MQQLCKVFNRARFYCHDLRTAEAPAPGTTAAPAVQAEIVAPVAAVVETETVAAVSEEQPTQAAVTQTAEVKTADAPVASTESSAPAEAAAR